jgi:predicted ATP-binding protein involved in virulence
MPAVNTRPVYFKSLELTNVRCFGDSQHLDMTDSNGAPSQWTLILGENGVGKTTLLQCLAAMRPVLAVNPNSKPDALTAPAPVGVEAAILRRNDEELVALSRVGETHVQLNAKFVVGQRFGTKNKRVAPGNPHVDISLNTTITVKDGELIDVSRTPAAMDAPVEPLVIAYGAARHMRYRGTEPFILDPDTTASLFDPSIELADAKDILEQLDYAKSKKQSGATKLLSRIKQALVKLLPDVQAASAISLYGPAAPGGTKGQKQGVQVRTPYGEVPLNALSLGYQTMTAWTVDLAWRLYQHFPNDAEPMCQPAIVLIDELDLHLHPRWQRTLRKSISEIFPKVQFIATAHSPLLAQSYLEMNLAVVREQNGHAIIESDPETVRTWRIDEVVTSSLYEVDSAFSPDISRDLQERMDLIRASRLTPAQKRRLKELNALADALAPKFDPSTEEALKIIRKASKLIDPDRK